MLPNSCLVFLRSLSGFREVFYLQKSKHSDTKCLSADDLWSPSIDSYQTKLAVPSEGLESLLIMVGEATRA